MAWNTGKWAARTGTSRVVLKLLEKDLHAITFDCWGTLLRFEPEPDQGTSRREAALHQTLLRAGQDRSLSEAHDLLADAHRRHVDTWERGLATGSPEIARWAFEAAGLEDAGLLAELIREFEETSLQHALSPLTGAVDTLRKLAERDIRIALICDTGFSPGRVVRQLLDRTGLLEYLEVQIFSNEVGKPKPHREVFERALEGLGVAADAAAHVGDLRRTDIQGSRQAGMRSIRICEVTNDQSDYPEADLVVQDHPELCEALGL